MAEADQSIPNAIEPEDPLGGSMTLREHLDELRRRLTIATIAVLVASFAVWPFRDFVFWLVQQPLPHGAALQQIAPTETLFVFIKISFIGGFSSHTGSWRKSATSLQGNTRNWHALSAYERP